MRRFRRHLKAIARLQRAGRLTLYGKIKATFEDIAGFDTRVRMTGDGHSGFYFHFRNYGHITRCWAIRL